MNDREAWEHYAEEANREPADGGRVLMRRRTGATVRWVELPPGVTATAHTYTVACAGHHGTGEPCPEPAP